MYSPIDPLTDINSRLDDIIDELTGNISGDRYSELMKEYKILKQTWVAIQSGNLPPSGTPTQLIPRQGTLVYTGPAPTTFALPAGMSIVPGSFIDKQQKIAELQRRYTFVNMDLDNTVILLRDELSGSLFSHPWNPNLQTSSEAYHEFIAQMYQMEEGKRSRDAKRFIGVLPHRCEAVNVGFTSAKRACKHCDRDM